MTVGFGKRYLEISVRIGQNRGPVIERQDAIGASDAELIQLARHDPRLDRRSIEAQLSTFGFRPIA